MLFYHNMPDMLKGELLYNPVSQRLLHVLFNLT